jgi:hypothetical protein
MRRIIISVLALLTCGLLVLGGVAGKSQSSTGTMLVTVTAPTVDSVPTGKTYLADISQDNTVYEFDPSRGLINFSRVTVRTATEQKPIEPWIAEIFAERLTGWQTETLRIGTATAFRNASDPLPRPPVNTPPSTEIIECSGNYCTCSGWFDCLDLITSTLCRNVVGCTHRGGGPVRCICDRRSSPF